MTAEGDAVECRTIVETLGVACYVDSVAGENVDFVSLGTESETVCADVEIGFIEDDEATRIDDRSRWDNVFDCC